MTHRSFFDAAKSLSLYALRGPFLSATMMQHLDIFADSRDVAMRNDVVEQLQLRDAAAAGAALTVLAAEYARHETRNYHPRRSTRFRQFLLSLKASR